MAEENTQNQAADPQAQGQPQKSNDKEYNFRQLEAKYQRQLEAEREARAEVERRFQELERLKQKATEEDDAPYTEPYVDDKYLNKKLSRFERKMEEKIEKKAEEKARMMVESERKNSWLKSNPDFYEVMSNDNVDMFAKANPELAETILEMPEGFERQKLVYKNIKALQKKAEAAPKIQEKVDQNRRSPYYQPSGIAPAPYASAGDYSPSGQKNAYAKMQELKSRLRI